MKEKYNNLGEFLDLLSAVTGHKIYLSTSIIDPNDFSIRRSLLCKTNKGTKKLKIQFQGTFIEDYNNAASEQKTNMLCTILAYLKSENI